MQPLDGSEHLIDPLPEAFRKYLECDILAHVVRHPSVRQWMRSPSSTALVPV